jgi:iron complex transport system ATP-binding protein
MIHVEDLSFSYDKNPYIEKLNLQVKPGFTALIGPNGSGKTTLLRTMSGMLEGYKGSISMVGKNIRRMSANERAKTFAVVNQKQNFTFPFSCLEFVSLGRYPHRKNMNRLTKEDYEIILESMRSMEVLHFKDKLLNEVSGGEQQRVVLACALAQKTKVLLLDEAFSALDIAHKANVVKLLRRRVEEDQLSVVSVMHDLPLAYRYADRVCVMQKGSLVSHEEPHLAMGKDVMHEVFRVETEIIEGRGLYINI